MAALPREDASPLPTGTASTIASFDRVVADVQQRPNHPHAKSWIRDALRRSADLKGRSNDLVAKMEIGERWLKDHEGHDLFAEREAQWLAWLHEYEAIEDALERAREIL